MDGVPADRGLVSREFAESLDQQIRVVAKQAHIVLEALAALVQEAKANRIHEALGFPSWTAYLADAIDGQWKLERDKRGEVVRYLADQGMSLRAIEAVTGISRATAARELAGFPLGQVIGLDGKTYARPEPGVPNETPDEEPGEQFLACMDAEMDDRSRKRITTSAPSEEPESPEARWARMLAIEERINETNRDIQRLERIKFAGGFAALDKLPNGPAKDARSAGLYLRWMRTVAQRHIEAGMSIKEVADAMEISVPEVEDYLNISGSRSSDTEFIAEILEAGQ